MIFVPKFRNADRGLKVLKQINKYAGRHKIWGK
jgi:hypothetical protein